jgi:4-hydroxybenzoate polyprenyltransferase
LSSRPLLQLLRPPNLFTVPGDPLCGALLASQGHWSWRIIPCAIISLAAYSAGLVINDLADFAEDLRDRPSRPLPSGGVSRRTAIALAIAFSALALAAAACASRALLILTALLLAEILWYNLMAKKSATLAPIAMGLCRGLSVMVGVVGIGQTPMFTQTVTHLPNNSEMLDNVLRIPPSLAFIAAAVITLYIAAVTALARTETRNPRIPPMIGALIRGLLFIQAAFCLAAGGAGYIAAALLLALWPISRLVGRRFYAS